MEIKLGYLQPIADRFGHHRGLNADWATMAWNVGLGLWISDDETSDHTVSLVRRSEEEEIEPILSSLPVGCILKQVQKFLNQGLFLAEFRRIYAELAKENPAYRANLGNLPWLSLKIMEGLRTGTAMKDGPVVKGACKALGIKNTYRAIAEFLEWRRSLN
jgi:hypothetical protein